MSSDMVRARASREAEAAWRKAQPVTAYDILIDAEFTEDDVRRWAKRLGFREGDLTDVVYEWLRRVREREARTCER